MKSIMKKVITGILVLLFFFFTSWFYKTIMLMLIAIVWKKKIKTIRPWAFKATLGVLAITLFWVTPRYRYDNGDRVRLIYQDKDGNPMLPPLSHWLVNVLLPEEELCNLGIWGAAIAPEKTPFVGGWIYKDFIRDLKRGKIFNFYHPYSNLNWSGNFMMSGTTSQAFNMAGFEKTQSVYLIEPKDYDEDKSYPVVFFMHGYLGNWKLYNGILNELDNCIVMGVGTDDLSGIFNQSDISQLFTKQIPFLEKMGYKPDMNNLHIIGLSNGGTATNVAYNSFSRRFKSITFISTGIHQTYPISSKVLLIGGGKDPSSGSIPGAYRNLRNNGCKTDMFWKDDEGHFILVNQTDEIIDFINRNLK